MGWGGGQKLPHTWLSSVNDEIKSLYSLTLKIDPPPKKKPKKQNAQNKS